MKLTVGLDVVREEQAVEAAVSMTSDGQLEIAVPTINRRAAVAFAVDPEELMGAVVTLRAANQGGQERAKQDGKAERVPEQVEA